MALRLTRRETLAGLGGAMLAPALLPRQEELEVPYVPTPHELVDKMLDLAALAASDYLIDLGCGDGRIAVAAAKRGARALGVDLDVRRVQQAQAAAQLADVTERARFRRQDLFETPIGEASVIALYLLPEVNLRLRPRLLTELNPGARIVSHAFDMADWEPDATEEHDGRRIFLWHVPAVAGGIWDLSGAASGTLELEQRFQQVQGTLSTAGASIPMTGRVRGGTLSMRGGTLRLEGRIGESDIAAADGSWQAVRAD